MHLPEIMSDSDCEKVGEEFDIKMNVNYTSANAQTSNRHYLLNEKSKHLGVKALP